MLNKSKIAARGGIYTSLGIMFIYIASILPTSKLFLLGLSTCVIMISVITLDAKNAMIVYAATSLLGLVFISSKSIAISYILLFGIYGIIKYYIEKLNKLYLEILFKFIFFNISLIIMFLLYKLVLLGNLSQIKYSLYLIFIILQGVFIIYDYILTLFAGYITKFFIKKS